jgi:hypothetical protein
MFGNMLQPKQDMGPILRLQLSGQAHAFYSVHKQKLSNLPIGR